MAQWTREMLSRLGDAETVLVVTRRPDGTLPRPVPVWIVRVGGDFFIRPVRGRYSGWYRAAREREDGQIRLDGVEQEVVFEPADMTLGDAIDDAYRSRYGDKSPAHFAPIMTAAARKATLRLIPVGPADKGG